MCTKRSNQIFRKNITKQIKSNDISINSVILLSLFLQRYNLVKSSTKYKNTNIKLHLAIAICKLSV